MNGCHPRRRLLSFSQNIVHEVHHVASGHSHAVAHEFASIVPFRLDVGFKSFDKSLGFLSQGFQNAVGDVGFYTIYSCRPRRFRFRCFSSDMFLFVSPRPSPRSLVSVVARAYIVHVVEATQELIVQRYLLPVLQIHSRDDRFHFVVETSNDVSDRI